MSKRISGTREWATHNVNWWTGCPHGCLYCYARNNALRFQRLSDGAAWATNQSVRVKEILRSRAKLAGRIMAPTTHDITPDNVGESIAVLLKLLRAGNELLIVSKPHPTCVNAMMGAFGCEFHGQITWRFTIGWLSERVGLFWEPGAPLVGERLACLHAAWSRGYHTSVSMEPLLEPERVGELVKTVRPYVNDSIWIGMANRLRERTKWCHGAFGAKDVARLDVEIERIEAGQTPQRVREIYAMLKDDPLIRWKDSYKKILGLPVATEAGLDK